MATVVCVCATPLLNFVADATFQSQTTQKLTQPFEVRAEGKGVNVARQLSLLGHDVRLICFAGGQSGAWLGALVQEQSPDVQFIAVPSQERIRIGWQETREDPGVLMERGFKTSPVDNRAFCEAVQHHVIESAAELCLISGPVPNPGAEALWVDIAEKIPSEVPLWVDSYGPAMQALLNQQNIALAKPNKEEFESLEQWQSVTELHVSNGRQPLQIRQGSKHWLLTPPEIEEANPIGSGDAYFAGLADAFLREAPDRDRWRWGSAMGAANAQKMSVCEVTPTDASALLDDVRITPQS